MTASTIHILVWLPSPMGDVIMSTPALQALRRGFPQARITLYGNRIARDILMPCAQADAWLDATGSPWSQARCLRQQAFSHVVLLKNSFGSALTCALARIPIRVGYARDGRGFLLTEKLHPPRRSDGRFAPRPMIDYYLALAGWLGVDVSDRRMQLSRDPQAEQSLQDKLPHLHETDGPLVVLVPGGAFGPSKCWAPQRYAALADWLSATYQATVALSVAPNPPEQAIARTIRQLCKAEVIDLSETTLTLVELKALIHSAALVVANDTGPRHIAVALQRPVITLFGPNDPAWTQTGWEGEVHLMGQAPCVPCQKPTCRMDHHLCMESISVEQVQQAAERVLSPSPG